MKSNNSTFTGIMLLVLLWLTYSILTAPTKEEIEAQKQAQQLIEQQDSLDNLGVDPEELPQVLLDSIKNDTTLTASEKDSIQNQLIESTQSSKFGIFAAAAKGPGEGCENILENEKLKITFKCKGGIISKVEIKDFLMYNQETEDPYDKIPLVVMDNPQNDFEYFVPMAGTARGDISTADLYFEPKLEGKTLSMRAYSADRSKYIEQKYTINDNYLLDYQLTLEGVNEHMPRDKNLILNWKTHLGKVEKNPYYEATMTTVYYKNAGDDFDYCDCRTSTQENLTTPVEWVSQSQQFFNTTIFTKEGTVMSQANLATEMLDPEAKDLKNLYSAIEFKTKDQKTATYDMQMYIGPNDYNELVAIGNDFERIIPFGWSIFGFISRSLIRPLFNFFALFISNYGIIILLLTFLIRLVLFPLQYKMILNGVKMSVIKPKGSHAEEAQR